MRDFRGAFCAQFSAAKTSDKKIARQRVSQRRGVFRRAISGVITFSRSETL